MTHCGAHGGAVRASTARPAHERRGRRRSADSSTLSRLGARSASPVSALREPSRRSDEESSSSQQAASSSSQQQAASSSSQQQAAAASSSKQQQQATASSSSKQQQAAASSSSKQQQAAARSSKQQQAAAASSSKQQQAASRSRTRSSTLRNVGDWRPDPSDSGRARGLGIGRQGATDIVRHREAGSHRKPTDFYENRSHSCAITRARSHRRLQAGSLETGKRKEKGETGSHPSTRTSSVNNGGSWVDPPLLS